MKRLLALTWISAASVALATESSTLPPTLTNGPAVRPPNALTLDECLGVAQISHPMLAAARAGVAAATESIGEARAPLYPQLDLNAGYHRWQRRAFLPSGLTIPGRGMPELIGPLDDWNMGLVSRMTLYDFGERRAVVDTARARLAGTEADAVAVGAEVRLRVRQAFYALAAAQELESIARTNLERTAAHERLAAARQAAGAVPQVDVLRTQAEVANARLQLMTAASRVRITRGRLNTAMGRNAEIPLVISAPPGTPPPPTRVEMESAMDRALAERPEITAAQKRADAARAVVAAAKAGRAPKLRADAAFGWRDTGFWPDSQEWQAGLSIDFPLFDANSRARRVARSRAELAREEAALASRQLQVREEAWATAAELERAWSAIAATEATVTASAESLRIVQDRYESGAAVITDLLDTQITLARAENGLAEAHWSYLAARADFERATGSAP